MPKSKSSRLSSLDAHMIRQHGLKGVVQSLARPRGPWKRLYDPTAGLRGLASRGPPRDKRAAFKCAGLTVMAGADQVTQ